MNNRREFVKNIGIGALSFSLFPSFVSYDLNNNALALPRSTPEQEGIASADILKLLQAIEESKIEFHSLMILRHGKVIAEGWWSPYRADLKHTLYSLSKSFTSTAIGFAVNEKKLSVEDKVISFFPEFTPSEVSKNLGDMRVKHLLTMSTGHTEDTTGAIRASADGNWVKTFLSLEVPKEPGTHFLYNTGATYMLSAIIQKITGKTLLEYLQPRLFQPLGIDGMDWEIDPKGINVGGYGLRVKTEDIAKLGLLYLQKGKWQGKQLLPETWIADASKAQVDSKTDKNQDNDWAQGYGYQFWRCKPGFYRGDGAFGQYCIIMPEQDTVIAITSESFDMGKGMKILWENLLEPLKNTQVLPANKDKVQMLQQDLKNLAIRPNKVADKSTISTKISGKIFRLEANDWQAKSVSFNFKADTIDFIVQAEKGTDTVQCGIQKWVTEKNARKTPNALFAGERTKIATKIAAWATWKDEKTLEIRWQYIENAHHDRLTCIFEDNKVSISFMNSLAIAQNRTDDRKNLVGTMQV